MTDIRVFIEARYAEREQAAKAAAEVGECGCHPGRPADCWTYNGDAEIDVDNGCGHILLAGASYGGTWLQHELGEYIALNDPRSVLDDLAAKRAILDQHAGANGLCGRCIERWDYHHDGCEECVDEPHETPVMYIGRPCPTVLLLAKPFRLHPEFDPAWRMEP